MLSYYELTIILGRKHPYKLLINVGNKIYHNENKV